MEALTPEIKIANKQGLGETTWDNCYAKNHWLITKDGENFGVLFQVRFNGKKGEYPASQSFRCDLLAPVNGVSIVVCSTAREVKEHLQELLKAETAMR